MTIEQTLQRLQATKARYVPLADLKTDEALQPREARLVPYREKDRVANRSEEHIGRMLSHLKPSGDIQLEPLLVADIDGRLLVVDGHHRLKAYQRAQRESAPARVMPMDRLRAVLVSKLVNCADRALEMHPEQQRDAAWQYIAVVTRQGTIDLPEGESLRTIAGRFCVSKDTIANMLRRIPKVRPNGFPPEKCDPGTGFPRWKVVREWRKQDEGSELNDQSMNAEHWTQREAMRVARKLGSLETSTTPDAWKLALRMYAEEAKLEARNQDTLGFLAEIAEPDLAIEDF
jgi:ParB-like chromosome segregation protein Spo0J